MTPRIGLIDYGAGNLRSAAKALERAAAESDAAGTVEVVAYRPGKFLNAAADKASEDKSNVEYTVDVE